MYNEKEKLILRKAAAIPLRLIYDNLPKEHLKLFLPYVIIPTGRKHPPHIIYLLTPDELNFDRNIIWPDDFFEKNKEFINIATHSGRKYKSSGGEKAAVYVEIERVNNDGTKKEPIDIEIYTKPYKQIRKKLGSIDELEYKGVDNLFPMLIYCKGRNGKCFLVISADYERSPFLDFKAIRWKESLHSIATSDFWDVIHKLVKKPGMFDLKLEMWDVLKSDAISILKKNLPGFGAHHMCGGREPNQSAYDDKLIAKILQEKDSWENFTTSYDYLDKISGPVSDWERPPVRVILETCEVDRGCIDLNDIIDNYLKIFDQNTLFIINEIPLKYNYMWFNIVALLKGIQIFIENERTSDSDKRFLITFNIIDHSEIRGALAQLYQITKEATPEKISDKSRYAYNSDFPFPKGQKVLRTLSDPIKYFFYAGAKLILYKAFDLEDKNYKQSTIKIIAENNVEILEKNQCSNNIYDATLCLFIPASADKSNSYRGETEVWRVADDEKGINKFICNLKKGIAL